MTALNGIRVLDLGTFIAGPHCATILGEFGAEVIKVEPPKIGDSLRRLGTNTDCGDTLVWLSEARNKKCVTLNLATERGREVLRQLAAKCDIIVENFRPGTIEKWGLSYDDLKKLNPGAILVRISAYGQDGPMRTQPGFARIAHAFSGLTYLAGLPGGVPVVPGSTSLADYMSGMYGAIGALVALQARQATGEGQCIDLALYESVFRALDEIAPAFQKFGYVRERMGADTVNVCPHSHYETSDGKWIAIACTSDAMFARLCGRHGAARACVRREIWPEGPQTGCSRRGECHRREMGCLAGHGDGAGALRQGRRAVEPDLQHHRYFRGCAVSRARQHQDDGIARRGHCRTGCRPSSLCHSRRNPLARRGHRRPERRDLP
jgi:crotonobetainyl-CoA:carnitine CoA-transferase CaiB-like acyl-CoA transferase